MPPKRRNDPSGVVFPRRRANQQVNNALRTARGNSQIADLTNEQWWETLQWFEGRCAYCGDGGGLDLDHYVPTHRGGHTTETNALPACPSCNRVKGCFSPEMPELWAAFPKGTRARVEHFIEQHGGPLEPGSYPLDDLAHWHVRESNRSYFACGIENALMVGTPRCITCDECQRYALDNGILWVRSWAQRRARRGNTKLVPWVHYVPVRPPTTNPDGCWVMIVRGGKWQECKNYSQHQKRTCWHHEEWERETQQQ